MHKTKNDLPDNVRKTSIELLQPRLADAIDLVTHAKQAHWNVKGPSFIALHELFEEVANAVRQHSDTMAERITALGGTAEGTARVAASRSTLAEYPLDIADGSAHVDALSSSLAAFGKHVREAIEEAQEAGDEDTMDILVEVSRDIDKYLWFVEAHAQASR